MKNELDSKRTYKITLTCPSHRLSICLLGDLKDIPNLTPDTLLQYCRSTLRAFVGSPVIQMEVEEVNPLQKQITMKLLNIKVLPLRRTQKERAQAGSVVYRNIFIVNFISGVSIGIEFPHLTKQLFSCAIDLGIIRFVFIRQLRVL